MTAALPYTKMFAGTVQATQVHQGIRAWPVHFDGQVGIYVLYDDRVLYDQTVSFNGLLLPVDVTLEVGVTRRRTAVVGDTRRNPRPGDIRRPAVVGQTRYGRRKERSAPTRVVRQSWLAVGLTRVTTSVGDTRVSAMIGPTRVQRRK